MTLKPYWPEPGTPGWHPETITSREYFIIDAVAALEVRTSLHSNLGDVFAVLSLCCTLNFSILLRNIIWNSPGGFIFYSR
jgi:hypothetical protein